MAAGDWDALALSAATMEGIVSVDFNDPDFDVHDTDLVETNVVAQAKRYITNRLIGALPEMVVRADGPDEFMDAATTISSVDDIIQGMIAWSYLIHFYEQERFSNADLYHDKMMNAKMRFEELFNAFVKYLPKDQDFIDAAEATASADLSRYGDTMFIG